MSLALGNVTPKMLGDAGEFYALSQLTLAGLPAAKMPDCWTGYDLAVENGSELVRISVKTRKETLKWKAGSWFTYNHDHVCDWLIFIFVQRDGSIRSWIIPFAVAQNNANSPGVNRKDPHIRDIIFQKLEREPLSQYENNWKLQNFDNQ